MTPKTIAILHGTEGHPGENWFPWLAEQAKNAGANVLVPAMPTPEGQNLDTWRSQYKAQSGSSNVDLIAGHSLGSAFALRIIEGSDTKFDAAFLASSFVKELGIPHFDDLNSSFISEPFDWDKIRASCGSFHIFHGSDDPYVPVDLGREVAEQTGGTFTLIEGGGHLNAGAGLDTFPELWDAVGRYL